MPIDLYYLPGSCPCRAVLLAAKALKIDLNLLPLNLLKSEHLTPHFLKINPQHTIPTMVDHDGGITLWESRAIMTYLADQYGKNDSLYPKDVKKRALVDQKLFFDVGTLYARYAEYYYPVMFFGETEYVPAKYEKVIEALQFLEVFLEGQKFLAGPRLTLADLSVLATVSSLEVVDFDFSPFKNLEKWLARVKAAAPGYEEANGRGIDISKKMIKDLADKVLIYEKYQK